MTVSDTATPIRRIRKRDGRVTVFDLDKIAAAISKAFAATYDQDKKAEAYRLAEEVLSVLETEGDDTPDVEHIQDIVERVLMENEHADAAKSYIIYRAERSRVRVMNGKLMKVYEELTFRPALDSDIKRENANIDGDTAMGTMLKYGSEGAKQFYEMFVLDPAHAEAHRAGDIHINDLDFFALTTTCCQIDIIKLFDGGFSTGHGNLREPNHIGSYAALCCIAIQSNQNDQHGGQSVVNFDYGMALGVRKTFRQTYRENVLRAMELLEGVALDTLDWPDADDKRPGDMSPALGGNDAYQAAEAEVLKRYVSPEAAARIQAFAQRHAERETDRATFNAMEAFVHNLNTMHSRAGAQTPFSSINYGLDMSLEGRMVIKNILLATEAGLGRKETPIFPIQIFRVKRGVNSDKDDPGYDLFRLACRVSAKRMFPNFSFMDAPFNAQYYKGTPETEIAYMGCRTRVIGNIYDPEKEISNGRGNLSFSSINLPRIALKHRRDITGFYREMDEKLDMIIDQLYQRYKIQAARKVRNYPFLMGERVWLDSDALGPDDEVGEILRHGTLSVGFIGLAETLIALTGHHHGQSAQSQALGLEIIGHMRARLDAESRRRRMNFTLIATPAEGLSGRFVALDRQRFGDVPGITDKEYYTNSFHIPVSFPITAFDKINLEAPYHKLTNAGHITYVELDGDLAHNIDAFERIVIAMRDAGVGYGSINHPIDRDPVCGFSGIIGDQCPGCGRREKHSVPFERIRRITGYLVGTLDRFNNAKRAEERDRIKHGLCAEGDARVG
ncbi:MAG: anaerobic ribonucleoside triphosphate reductase [Oscillospiraceae bacterium]|jgi:ribonucleoside-triphosphate reductase|nr:anaerobic ribonucleoside triphosphate reductase [Oscillospiraceae bacterium]